MMLSVQGLFYGVEYKSCAIVHNFCHDFLPGTLSILCGGNGSGKTTLLQLLAGLYPGDRGEILWHGKSIQDPLYAMQVVWMGHHLGCSSHLTVQETLVVFSDIFGPRDKTYSLQDVIDLLHLRPLLHHRVGECSAGQKRRLALSRLWLLHRPIYLLDEPDASLDQEALKGLKDRIQDLLQRGTLVIMSAHHPYMEALPHKVLTPQDWGMYDL